MKYKRLLSLTMAAAMICGFAAALPDGVFETSLTINANAESTATSGQCGDNVYWSVQNDVLTISGTGDMEDYGFFSRPFAGLRNVKSVVIKSGVTSIGEFAFHECYSITSITIPGSVKSIGEFAFYDCTSLEKVNLPKSITNIGSNAFKGCISLKSISIPSSITSIGDYVFCKCKSLTKVTIPSSVTSIGISAFEVCTNLKSVTIPSSVTSISAWAFSGTKWLENQRKKNPLVVVNEILIDGRTCEGKVTIPSSVKSVANGAFAGCKNLTSVTVPSSVKSIGWSAFNGCTSLTKATIPSSVSSISNSAFEGCTNLKSITIPSSVKSIGSCAFSSCKSLTSVTIPSSVTSIGKKAFYYCENLTKATIKSGIKSIGEEAFSNCENLISITIPGSVTSIGKSAFYFCKGLASLTIQKGVKSIGEEAFQACTSLTSVTLPSSVENIGMCAFRSCSNLTSVTIPGSVTSIGNEAFAYCRNLKSVTMQKGVTTIEEKAFDNCTNLTSVIIPSSVKSIGEHAFYSCTSLTKVTIPDSVTSIGNEAFGHYYYNDSFQFGKVIGFTIYGYKGTAAEKYAKDNEFKFVVIKLPKATRLAGDNRYATATKLSGTMYKTSDTVILATGLTYQDALIAVPLASAYNAPLLLGTERHITAQTEAELKRLKAKNVIVVSTNGAIGDKAKAELKALKLNTTYIEGKTDYETAAKVAATLQKKAGKAPYTIFFATDSAFADALSASPVAAIMGAPIIYLKNTGSIDSATANYLKSVKGKVKNAYIIGGDGVISDAMMKNVANALGLTSGETVVRVAGANRYETCVAINNKFNDVLTGTGICVSKGLDFPDALAGGVYAAKNRQALFLADGKKLQDVQSSYLKSKNASKITVFGGTGAVSDELVKLIAQASL